MYNLSQELKEKFKNENGMTIESAVEHIEKWIKEGNYDSAEAGILEIRKFQIDFKELQELDAQLRAKKSEKIQKSVVEKENLTVSTSNLEDVTKSEKFLSAIGYFGFLSVLPLALKPESEFCKYHGKQALLLSIIFTIISAISVILPGGFGLMSIFHVIVSVYGFMQAHKGKLWNMPFLGDVARKLPI